MDKKKIAQIVRFVNIPRHICDHVLNKKHTKAHRISAGMILMVIGVLIAKSAVFLHVTVLHIGVDVIGYGLHGVGLTPVLEHFVEEEEEETV